MKWSKMAKSEHLSWRKPTLDIFFLSPLPPFPPLRGMSIYSLIVVQAVSLSASLTFCEGREHFLKIFGSTHHSLWVQNLRISLLWHIPSGCLFSPFILALLAVPYFLIYMLPSKWHWTENTIWMTINKQTSNRQNSNLYFWTTATLQLLQPGVFPYFQEFTFLQLQLYQHLRRRHISNLHISMLVFHISRS